MNEIEQFIDAPQNYKQFINNYPNFDIPKSYIEKRWVKNGVKHLLLMLEIEKLAPIPHLDNSTQQLIQSTYNEMELENWLNHPQQSSIKKVSKEIKERVLNRNIITALKKYYLMP